MYKFNFKVKLKFPEGATYVGLILDRKLYVLKLEWSVQKRKATVLNGTCRVAPNKGITEGMLRPSFFRW